MCTSIQITLICGQQSKHRIVTRTSAISGPSFHTSLAHTAFYETFGCSDPTSRRSIRSLNGGGTRGRDRSECLRFSAQTDYRRRNISGLPAPYVVLHLQSYRWSKIVLPVRKTITFRHLFLSKLGLQLYLSLNNLRLFSLSLSPPSLFLLFLPLLLSISHVRRLQGLKGCSCQIKLLRTK